MPPEELASHQQRVILEQGELNDKIEKLNSFLDASIFATLETAEQIRLQRQLTAMINYRDILLERIAAFN